MMNTLDIIEFIIEAEALGMMIFVIIKLWYYDVHHKKTKIVKKIEARIKYDLFKKVLLFTFIYVISMFLRKILVIGQFSKTWMYVFSIIGNVALIFLFVVLLKISQKTYGPHHKKKPKKKKK